MYKWRYILLTIIDRATYALLKSGGNPHPEIFCYFVLKYSSVTARARYPKLAIWKKLQA